MFNTPNTGSQQQNEQQLMQKCAQLLVQHATFIKVGFMLFKEKNMFTHYMNGTELCYELKERKDQQIGVKQHNDTKLLVYIFDITQFIGVFGTLKIGELEIQTPITSKPSVEIKSTLILELDDAGVMFSKVGEYADFLRQLTLFSKNIFRDKEINTMIMKEIQQQQAQEQGQRTASTPRSGRSSMGGGMPMGVPSPNSQKTATSHQAMGGHLPKHNTPYSQAMGGHTRKKSTQKPTLHGSRQMGSVLSMMGGAPHQTSQFPTRPKKQKSAPKQSSVQEEELTPVQTPTSGQQPSSFIPVAESSSPQTSSEEDFFGGLLTELSNEEEDEEDEFDANIEPLD